MQRQHVILGVKAAAWLALLYGSTLISMEKIFFIVSCLYFIFTHLGKRKDGDLSAYSIFNKGNQKIAGDFSADEFLYGRKRGNDNSGKFQIDEEEL